MAMNDDWSHLFDTINAGLPHVQTNLNEFSTETCSARKFHVWTYRVIGQAELQLTIHRQTWSILHS